MIAFHRTGKPLTLGDTGNINHVSGLKQADINLLAHLNSFNIIYPEFPQVLEFCRFPGAPSPGGFWSFGFTKAKLSGIIAIFIYGFYLRHRAWASLDGSYRLSFPILTEYLGHTQLLANNPFGHNSTNLYSYHIYTVIIA
jgi:hypothetical protein